MVPLFQQLPNSLEFSFFFFHHLKQLLIHKSDGFQYNIISKKKILCLKYRAKQHNNREVLKLYQKTENKTTTKQPKCGTFDFCSMILFNIINSFRLM